MSGIISLIFFIALMVRCLIMLFKPFTVSDEEKRNRKAYLHCIIIYIFDKLLCIIGLVDFFLLSLNLIRILKNEV